MTASASLRNRATLLAETAAAEPAVVPEDGEAVGTAATREPQTIADVIDWARKRIATLAGVRMVDAVKLDCRIEKLRLKRRRPPPCRRLLPLKNRTAQQGREDAERYNT